MGMSSDGIIAFGVLCEDGYEFPWDTGDCELDVWWRNETGYKPLYTPFTPEGEYAEGWDGGAESDAKFKELRAAERAWDAKNPCPVELENYCSGDCPMYAVCVPGTSITANRGYPQDIPGAGLYVSPEKEYALTSFLEKYGIEGDGKPRWLLMSYMG